MANCSSPPRLLVFWTTLFLGIFELMHGETGDGWLMHMVHGTASALQAAGPLACQSGLGLSFFLQARIFEASRALLLGERSFLSNPEWDRFTNTLPSVDGLLQRSRLDGMLDVIVQCSKLRAQTVQMLARVDSSQVSQVPIDAPSISKEGLRLRQLLEAWRTEYPALRAQTSPIPSISSVFRDALEDLISSIFFAAISIYLSGIFDYEILHWQRWGISVPTIAEIEVQEHLGDLIMKASMLTTAWLPSALADFYLYYQLCFINTNGAWRHSLMFNWRDDVSGDKHDICCEGSLSECTNGNPSGATQFEMNFKDPDFHWSGLRAANISARG
ncbi:hypothetical protein PG993_010977 [Apiospora rasikravindrae]|uniref:Uncharacterized protein n=1 Tax=Apiospora rasikravindrae TaxID=990691 RepID=A0ABR1SD82_9PEZI